MVAAETSEGVLTATEIRRFLLHGQSSETPSTASRDASSSPPGNLQSSAGLRGGVDEDQAAAAPNPERLKEIELDEMLRALDLDGDGKIKMDDFLRLLLVPQEDSGPPHPLAERGRSLRRIHQRCTIL